MKKKLIAYAALAAAVLVLAGCPGVGPDSNDPGSETEGPFTVTFDSKGGTDVAAQDIESGKLVTAPAAPTRTGYGFGGWYADDACTDAWDFDTDTVTDDLTLYAKWVLNGYTVTFHSGAGTAVDPVDVNHGETVAVPSEPTRSGYDFGGWYADADYTDAWAFDTDTVTADITLYAKWTAVSYAITYVLNNGTNGAANPASYTIESAVIVLEDPVRLSRVFEGWYGSDDYSGDLVTDIPAGSTGDVTLYAKWGWDAYSLRDIGPSGGWIFYVNPDAEADDWKYLELSPAAADSAAGTRVWGTSDFTVPGADGTAIGTGAQNTLDIIAGDSAANKAADFCGSYSVAVGDVTYDDWFLPSQGEIHIMYLNICNGTDSNGDTYDNGTLYAATGLYNGQSYWSSTEVSSSSAWQEYLTADNPTHNASFSMGNGKTSAYRVRPVRMF
jgi:uncharacterized repeat protein (TIGR02543 family)